jgi:hypothetical protein
MAQTGYDLDTAVLRLIHGSKEPGPEFQHATLYRIHSMYTNGTLPGPLRKEYQLFAAVMERLVG